jgi:CheY-like chemotaxis protein
LSCLSLPFDGGSSRGAFMSDAERADATSLAEPKRPLVLVVDDDDAIREALCELLEDAGFATVGARHGLDALKVLATSWTTPAFILLDLMMPIMDGWAFCRSRWKSRTLREIPVILISSVDMSESNRPTGIDAFLPKPIDVDKFARLAVRMAGRSSFRARPSDVLH